MMGLYHTGVLKALIENNMLPRVLSGASAGSICASLVSTRNDSEWEALMYVEKGSVVNFSDG